MPSADERLAIKERAEQHLLGLPGVHAVGLGTKMVDGRPTDRLAIRVYVHTKRPEAELSPAERVPAQINGVETDVIEEAPPKPEQRSDICDGRDCEIEDCDEEAYRPLRGGLLIQTPRPGSRGVGTLGFLAESLDPPFQPVLVTNRHVLTGAVGDKVGQPDLFECDGCCTSIVGNLHRWVTGQDEKLVDGAIATLASGVSYVPMIEEIGFIRGESAIPADLPVEGIPVRKRGFRTRLTRGVVRELHYTTAPDPVSGLIHTNQLRCDPQPPLRRFSCPGDSGAAWVDDENKIIGLHWAGNGRMGTAARIDNVTSLLRIRPLTGSDVSEPARVPGALAGTGPLPPIFAMVGELLGLSGTDMVPTPTGRALGTFVLAHGEEVRQLTLSNRQVARAWLANGGPMLIHRIARAVRREEPLPAAIDGVPLDEALDAVSGILSRHGTARLRRDLPRFRASLDGLGRSSAGG